MTTRTAPSVAGRGRRLHAKWLTRTTLLLATCSALVGCGAQEETTLERAFDPQSQADTERLGTFFAALKPLKEAQLTTIKGFAAGDPKVIRRGVTDLRGLLRTARAATVDVEGEALERDLLAYLAPLDAIADSEDRILDAFDAEAAAGKPATDAELEPLLADFKEKSAAVNRSERRLEARLLEATPADERDAFRQALEKSRKEVDAARVEP